MNLLFLKVVNQLKVFYVLNKHKFKLRCYSFLRDLIFVVVFPIVGMQLGLRPSRYVMGFGKIIGL